jgi:protein TonB
MNDYSDSRTERNTRPPRTLSLCLVFSLLLHLSCTLLIPQLFDQQPSLEEQPLRVTLVDLPKVQNAPQADPNKVYELDQQPLQKTEKEVQSLRKADFNQKVERETAPKGEDVRDQTRAERPIQAASARPQQKPLEQQAEQNPAQQQSKTTTQERKPPLEAKPVKTTELAPESATDKSATAEQTKSAQEPAPLLTAKQLLPSTKALAQIAQGDPGINRIKERDVEEGEVVWLNLQHDMLLSFFRRFHDQIEMVWHYPSEAIRNNIQGTLQLEIVVDKQGNLLDVDLKRSSGSDQLDYEAIQAVYRGAPFGPLSAHYPHEKLRIRANFSYRIGGMTIYGSR